MRLTIPTPLGSPIIFDTTHLSSRLSPPLRISSLLHRRAQLRLVLLLLLIFTILGVRPNPPFPPSYRHEWKQERNLPWAYGGANFPEGREGRYLKFDVPRGTGFNHQLQRVLLHHHLAVLGNRSLAYEPFVQDDISLPFRIFHWPWRSARIPLSAFISTVISGFEAFHSAPRAVPASQFSRVCPSYKQRVYSLKNDENPSGELDLVPGGQARIHQLQVLLAGSDVGCIRMEGEVFDDAFFDSRAPLELYDSFARSPVLKHLTFSPTILSLLNRVVPEIAPDTSLYDLEAVSRATSENPYETTPWRHVLALHLRRGKDWQDVCEEKGMRSAPFVSFNKLPNLPGNENIPPPAEMVEASRMGLYRAKCLPSTLEIIARARRMRKNHPLLRVVYILTDADDRWAEEIRMWLASEGWDRVWIGGGDIYPEYEDREVGVAVDMEVARRAGVFVGNGFSTTSSNIVLLRTRDGIHTDLTQFW